MSDSTENARKGKVASIEWRVSADALEFLCRNLAGAETAPSGDEVIQAFREAGIAAEIEPERLRGVLETPKSDWIVVAQGVAPIPPKHGYLEYYLDPSKLDGRAADTDAGGVDFKHLNLILNVRKGQELVRRHAPVPGESGLDVFGNPVAPEAGREVPIPAGPGIEIVEDGYLAIATEDGALVSGRNGITVTQLFTVSGDVSYKTGNIDFSGSIDVSGNVLSGFEVKADGDVLIHEVVEAAKIETSGNVTILGGIQGGGKAIIRAGGNVRAKFASEATIEAGGDVSIQSQIVNCHVRAHGEVAVGGDPGTIVGGEIHSGLNVRANLLGSPGGVRTLVQIGLDGELQKKISTLEEDFRALEEKSADICRILGGLEHLKGDAGNLTPEQEAIRVKVIREKFVLKGQMTSAAEELASLRRELEQTRKGRIRAEDTVFGGVTLRIGPNALTIGHAMRHATFYYDKGEICSSAS